MNERYWVMLHGVQKDDLGNEESCHCDGLDGKPDGFNVWLRDFTPANGEPWHMVEEWDADFASLEAARLYAEALAAKFETEIDEY